MATLTMEFRVFHPDNLDEPIGGDEYTEIQDHMNCEGNAESAVNDAIEHIYDDETWDQEFGLEDSNAELVVVVTVPSEIAGTYRVDLERVTKARARRVES